jgi:hypothetical protein
VFNDKNSSILQVIYRGINTLRLSSSLQRVEDRDLFMEVCTRLETTAMDTFSPGRIVFVSVPRFRRDVILSFLCLSDLNVG